MSRIGSAQPSRSELDLLELPQSRAPSGAAAASTFAGELGKAISAVDSLQVKADAETEALARGGGNLHETALALEKADVALRVAVKVRNKVVEAYQEIMRMNV